MTGARRGGWATELIHGVEDLLYPASHALMLSTNRFDPDLERRCLEQLAHRGVDGIPLVFTCPFGRPRRRRTPARGGAR